MDSTYHSLMSVTHASYRALRDKQGRPYEQEYYNPDGVSILLLMLSAALHAAAALFAVTVSIVSATVLVVVGC